MSIYFVEVVHWHLKILVFKFDRNLIKKLDQSSRVIPDLSCNRNQNHKQLFIINTVQTLRKFIEISSCIHIWLLFDLK